MAQTIQIDIAKARGGLEFIRVENALARYFEHLKKTVEINAARLITPRPVIEKLRARTDRSDIKLRQAVMTSQARWASQLGQQAASLEALSPLKVVARGYSITSVANTVVTSIKQVKVGDSVSVRLSDGQIEAEIKKIEKLKT